MSNPGEREQAISILRACLISNKGGIPLSILNRDYRSLVGVPLPFKKLGYNSVEDFLKSINEITVSPGTNGELTVKAKPSEQSAHIASLVNRQKTTQKKRVPIPRFSQSRKPVNQSWKPPPSSHSQVQTPRSGGYLAVTVSNDLEKPSRLVTVRNKNSDSASNVTNRILPPRFQKLKDEIRSYPNQSSHENISPIIYASKQAEDNYQDYREIPSNFEENYETGEDYDILGDDYDSYQSGVSQKSSARKSITSPFTPRNALEAGRAKTQAMAVKELEDKYASVKIVEGEFGAEEQFEDYNMDVAPWNRTKPGVGKVNAKSYEDTYVQRLLKYSNKKCWPEPVYKIIPRQPKNCGVLYGCQVKVGYDQHFSSYPDESYLEEEAKEFAAKKAYNKLVEIDESTIANGYNVTADLNTIHERIFKLVENHPTGLWNDAIDALYSTKYQERLPPDWMNKAAKYPRLTFNKITEGKVIILPNVCTSLEETAIEKMASTSTLPVEPPSILGVQTQILPSNNFWDVFITFVGENGEVWLRIIGAEYSEQYDNMACEMELFYVNSINDLPSPPSDLRVNGFFAARVVDESGDSWHRICIQDLNWETKKAECLLIDHGDTDTLSFKQIYSLANQFTHLPRQAVLCTLAGLEDYVVDDEYKDKVIRMFLGKVLIANVVYRDDDNNEYSIILFDTKGDEDINLTEELINCINIESSKPELPGEFGVAEVFVSHITDTGKLYVQIQSDVYNHLINLIANLDPEDVIKNCFVFSKQIKSDKIYLVQYDEDGAWYRAVVTQVPTGYEKQLEVYFVDYGNTALVDVTKICNLEEISDLLSRIPKQALPVMLHGVEVGPKECTRLKELIPESEPVVLRVITSGEIPLVEILKRTSEVEGGGLISINSTISLERARFFNSSTQRRPSLRRSRSSSRPNTPSVSRPESPCSPSLRHGDTVHFSLSPPVIPDIGSAFFDVFVTMAANPDNFIVQPLNNISSLKQLAAKMKDFYSSEEADYRVPRDNLVEGGLYAALFENDQWYRVTLSSVVHENVSVHSCDFGEYSMVSTNSLRYLAPQFTELPYQGIKAKLSGITPAHGDWSVQDCLRFQDLVVDKQLVSVILEKGPDILNPNVTVLALQLIDTNTDDDIIIGDLLVNEKRAKKVLKNVTGVS